MTWAGDDCLYASMDDGLGWLPGTRAEINTRVVRIGSGPVPLRGELVENFPDHPVPGEWYGYGMLSVGKVLYNFITCASNNGFSEPFRGAKLVCSPDGGSTWLRHDGCDAREQPASTDAGRMFFWEECGDYRFSCLDFLQAGRDYHQRRDDYAYVYSPGGWKTPHLLRMARVPVDKILERGAYEFFLKHEADGDAAWTRDIAQAGVAHVFPDNYGWYSWLPSVVYNEPLGLYLMATGGTGRDGEAMHGPRGSLMLLWARRPWGPWTAFHWDENWTADEDDNRLYQPKLCPKWISADGRELWLVFSDQREKNYRWNQRKITLELGA